VIPPEAFLIGLASLPRVGPRRLEALLLERSPEEAWQAVCTRTILDDAAVAELLRPDPPAVAVDWQKRAQCLHPAELLERHRAAGIEVSWPGSAWYPSVFIDDPEPPVVLFSRGDLSLLDGPRLAVVGTRRCTRYGADVAFELGREISQLGVRVVSGLALGIDGAAHAGVLDTDGAGSPSSPPVAVVGCGLDVVYPRQHRELWRRIERVGLLLSEYPLGAQPRAWRFPARNRLIAALADVVVVVESGCRGGSMYTADEALRRDRPVVAVPGPITSPVSAGTNRLLADSAQPYLGVETVITEFALNSPARTRASEHRPQPSEADRDVLDAMGWEPTSLEHLVLRCARPLRELVGALDRLEHDGWAAERGGFWERVGQGSRS
jgi:DNA processing protein